MGYFCVDNLPAGLISRMVELAAMPGTEIEKLVMVIDVRGGIFFDELLSALDDLEQRGFNYRILFLEASDESLVRRYKETRRSHPLAKSGDVVEGISAERKLLSTLKGRADLIIDTSALTGQELRVRIGEFFRLGAREESLKITLLSFGYKFGVPLDADIVFDVRFLPNPYWIEDLRDFDGTEPKVRDYVMGLAETREFLKRFKRLLDFVLPYYLIEGKSYLTIAIGCTGGKHRSVVLAEEISRHLADKGYRPTVKHRDYHKT